MGIGANRLAFYAPLAASTAAGSSQSLPQIVSNTTAWWDASAPTGLLGPGGAPVTVWNSGGTALIDLTGGGTQLVPFSTPSSSSLPVALPHLCGLLGGVGFPVAEPNLLQPALDPSAGWQISGATINSGSSWTWFMVWSRPNWRQGTSVDGGPITLMTIGSQPILQIDSSGGANRLVLFPGSGQIIVTTAMTRRHTHSFLLRYTPVSGADLWLDNVQVAQAVQPSGASFSGGVLLLHDGSGFGAAQCWFHEAAEWSRSLSDSDVALVLSYAGRWLRGVRKGIYLLLNGQSNAINYALNDGAAGLLAKGIAWYLGALAYNVLATTGSPSSYTMQSGHGIYAVSTAGYPGSFVQDPGDGSNPAGWQLGADGQAVQQAVSDLPAEDIADLCGFIWPWNETDSLRQYSEYATFEAAALRFLTLLRTMVGDTSNRIPLVWWNAIPYGSADGVTMHRQVVKAIASNQSQNVIVGNPQTSDSNPRGSTWDPATGVATGGDPSHRDSADNQRFAMLAAPVIAQRLSSGGFADSITAIPTVMPEAGGPSIAHVYRQTSTTLILTIVHDSGTDLKVPLQAAQGLGFAVMDGGAPGNAGTIVSATACARVDSTHLKITLGAALQNPSSACQLFYPYGPSQIGRGNAITDNFSDIPMPAGWDIGTDLGASWQLDCPLAATFSGIPLSDSPT
jgi:hypothetical protein